MMHRYRTAIAPALLLTLSALIAGCAGNPATGGTSVVMSSRAGEASLGSKEHEKMLTNIGAYDDPELQAYIERIGQRLVAESDEPDLPFTFTVLDMPDVNAFATPGGYIYITRGLLAHLDNEAELAAVLGHEIGHITARHHGRQKAGATTTKVLATTVGIFTGSRDLMDASEMYGAELVSGYGREMELEADGLGAQYMHKSGYDPEAMLDVLGVLKDREQYHRLQARQAGKRGANYHGLYASHPSKDQRLQKVIRTAGSLDLDTFIESPEIPGEFKAQMEGLVWGESTQSDRAENRYYHNRLAFTFERPEGWQVSTTSRAIVATAPDGTASVTINLRNREAKMSPKKVLAENASGELSEEKKLEQAGLEGYTAIASGSGQLRRLAVIDFNRYSYLFEGEAADFAGTDEQLLALIESFRPSHPKERQPSSGQYVHYIQVPRGATMTSLAGSSPIEDAEAQLRLINGLYPRGEPRTGDWIKVVR